MRIRGDVKWYYGYLISKIQKMRNFVRFLEINCNKEEEEFYRLKEV